MYSKQAHGPTRGWISSSIFFPQNILSSHILGNSGEKSNLENQKSHINDSLVSSHTVNWKQVRKQGSGRLKIKTLNSDSVPMSQPYLCFLETPWQIQAAPWLSLSRNSVPGHDEPQAVLIGSNQAASGREDRTELEQEVGAVTLFVYWPSRNPEGAAMSGLSGWIRALSPGNSGSLPTQLGPPHRSQEHPPRLARMAGVGLSIPGR